MNVGDAATRFGRRDNAVRAARQRDSGDTTAPTPRANDGDAECKTTDSTDETGNVATAVGI